uniref:Trans-acting factor B n=1 Tax=Kluyveromyces lactis TaxID=28985 RepID=REP1_KLULC|nr:RecName: Full=Trans-acting factor B; AltName: Full=REP1 [Kluyveromyces lactis]CAA27593.1 unnamed protein product [Kluyveromyces lactis]
MSAPSESSETAAPLLSDLSPEEQKGVQQVREIYRALLDSFKFKNEYNAYDPLNNTIITQHGSYEVPEAFAQCTYLAQIYVSYKINSLPYQTYIKDLEWISPAEVYKLIMERLQKNKYFLRKQVQAMEKIKVLLCPSPELLENNYVDDNLKISSHKVTQRHPEKVYDLMTYQEIADGIDDFFSLLEMPNLSLAFVNKTSIKLNISCSGANNHIGSFIGRTARTIRHYWIKNAILEFADYKKKTVPYPFVGPPRDPGLFEHIVDDCSTGAPINWDDFSIDSYASYVTVMEHLEEVVELTDRHRRVIEYLGMYIASDLHEEGKLTRARKLDRTTLFHTVRDVLLHDGSYTRHKGVRCLDNGSVRVSIRLKHRQLTATWIELEPIIENGEVKDVMFKLSTRVQYTEENENETRPESSSE